MILLDLFCGRWGWSQAFAKRGWHCVGVDLTSPPEVPEGCSFQKMDVLDLTRASLKEFDAIVASSPCEEFSVHGMKHFHPNPKYPEMGIKLFNYTQQLCEAAGVPYVMENVRAAQQFVGNAVHHCGPFYLWGNAIPPILNQGIKKGKRFRGAPGAYMEKRPMDVSRKEWRNRYQQEAEKLAGGRANCANVAATIPPELANCVAEYFERVLESKAVPA